MNHIDGASTHHRQVSDVQYVTIHDLYLQSTIHWHFTRTVCHRREQRETPRVLIADLVHQVIHCTSPTSRALSILDARPECLAPPIHLAFPFPHRKGPTLLTQTTTITITIA
jgi:hypothetical protein